MERGPPYSNPRAWRAFAFAFEALAILLAAPIAWLAGVPLLGGLRFDLVDLLTGVLAIAPMLLIPWWVLRSPYGPARELRALVLERLAPIFDGWSVRDLLALSALAGIAEEVLFRAALQGGLAELLGGALGLIAASVLFGAAHAVSRLYAVLAAVIGVYLGALWMLSGNLLVPVVAHAGYDAIALLWLVRLRERPS